MSIIEEIGHPGIQISDYKCLGESASATIKIQSELVFAEDQLDMSLAPHDSPDEQQQAWLDITSPYRAPC
jgi:hypothetical protein